MTSPIALVGGREADESKVTVAGSRPKGCGSRAWCRAGTASRSGAWATTFVTDERGNVLAQAAGGLGKSEFLELLDKADQK